MRRKNALTDLPRLKDFRYHRLGVWAYHRFALSTADVEDWPAARYVMAAINHPRDQAERLTGVFENFDRKMMPDTAQACIQRDNPHIQNSVHSKIIK